jgi:hypothetical protein
MEKENKDRSVTLRIKADLYQKCINKALKIGLKEGRIVNISEAIRIFIEKGVK